MVMSDIAPSYIMLESCLCVLSGLVLLVCVRQDFSKPACLCVCVCVCVCVCLFLMSKDIITVGVQLVR